MPQSIWMTVLFAFVISVALGPLFIGLLRRRHLGQQIRDDGPAHHWRSVTTAGGVLSLLAAAVALLVRGFYTSLLGMALLLTLGNALIGWLDDYAKISRGRSLGLKARNKIAGQALVTAIFTGLLYFSGHYDPVVTVPYSGFAINLGWFYPVFIFIIIMATTNAVNLSDGIDGLAGGTAIITLLAF